MSLENAVHTLIDVVAGRRNLSEPDADGLHEEVGGLPAPEFTDADKDALAALQAKQDAAAVPVAGEPAEEAAADAPVDA